MATPLFPYCPFSKSTAFQNISARSTKSAADEPSGQLSMQLACANVATHLPRGPPLKSFGTHYSRARSSKTWNWTIACYEESRRIRNKTILKRSYAPLVLDSEPPVRTVRGEGVALPRVTRQAHTSSFNNLARMRWS